MRTRQRVRQNAQDARFERGRHQPASPEDAEAGCAGAIPVHTSRLSTHSISTAKALIHGALEFEIGNQNPKLPPSSPDTPEPSSALRA